MYYRSDMTGKIVTDKQLKILDRIWGDGFASNLIVNGLLIPCEAPSVVELLKQGNFHLALARYREIHPKETFEQSVKIVKWMSKDVRRNSAKVETVEDL